MTGGVKDTSKLRAEYKIWMSKLEQFLQLEEDLKAILSDDEYEAVIAGEDAE
jgi:hypothetical protein